MHLHLSLAPSTAPVRTDPSAIGGRALSLTAADASLFETAPADAGPLPHQAMEDRPLPPPVVIAPHVQAPEAAPAARVATGSLRHALQVLTLKLLACPNACARRAGDGCEDCLAWDLDDPNWSWIQALSGCCALLSSPGTACCECLAGCFGRNARQDCTCDC